MDYTYIVLYLPRYLISYIYIRVELCIYNLKELDRRFTAGCDIGNAKMNGAKRDTIHRYDI